MGQAKRRATQIRPKAAGGILDGFSRCSFRPEVASDVITGVVNQDVGMHVCANFGDSRSNRSRDIRLPHFVMNDDNNDNDAGRRTQ